MSINRKMVLILILTMFFSSGLFMGGSLQAAVGKWEIFELTLTAANGYGNEYTDVTLTATFTSPSLNTIEIPGFWDGGQTWKVRMAPNEIGMWTYDTVSIPSDNGLETSGTFECVASSKKGFIQVNPSDPYKFQYADGTPFFWMGDTSWHLFSDDIDYDTEFKPYIDRRASQHFTNIHAALDVRALLYGHETGEPFVGDDFDRINPAYFQNVDAKVDYITSKGMVMGLFLTWAQRFIQFSQERFERYETYAIARYAAYNVYWVISGEFEEEATPADYAYHGNFIDQVDPYDHPISIHTLNSCNEFGNDSWLTYVMHQQGEQDSTMTLQNLLNQLGRSDITPVNNPDVNIADGADTLGVKGLYTKIEDDRIYNKPVVNAEFGYEAYDGWNNRTGRTTPDTVRRLAWNLVMAGGFFTYGMDKTYKVFDKNGMTNDWHLPAQELGGSDYMRLLYEFFAGTEWWEMNPDNSVITSGPSGHAVALVNPGTEYVVYLRSGSSVSVDLSSVSGSLKVVWFDTKDGETFCQGMVSGGGVEAFTKPAGIDGEGVLHLYNPGDELIIDFGGLGLYQYDGTVWNKPASSDPQCLAVYGNKLVGDFGGVGVWEFDGSSWTRLTSSDADNTGNCMVAYGTGLAIDFGGLGLYRYEDSVWSKLTVSDPEHLAVYGNKLVGDFGVYGLWEYDGAHWVQLTPTDPDNTGNCMVAYGTGLAIDFGVFGLYQYDGGGWSRLTHSDAEYLAVYDGKLVGDFGVYGLWEYDGAHWAQLTPTDPDNTGNCMVAYGTGLAIDFGVFGLYRYEGGIWSKLTVTDPEHLAVYGDKLVGDFGGAGLWEFDGSSWTKLTPADADSSGNCMMGIDFM